MKYDFSELKKSVGKTSPVASETASAAPIARLAATFSMPAPAAAIGDTLPTGWHGIYFGALHRTDNMRPDGQAISSNWMPDVPLAHYRLGRDDAEYPGDIRVGDELKRHSTITDVSITGPEAKPLLHITQRSEISGPRGLAVIEERESLYFDGERPMPDPAPRLPSAEWTKIVEPDLALMFRYSAVRFNSHRIHYDRDFATKVEGLPGLVVQATLTAQLSLELCRARLPHKRISAYALTNRHPTYDTGPFTICGAPAADGKSVAMWTLDSQGSVAQSGEIRFQD